MEYNPVQIIIAFDVGTRKPNLTAAQAQDVGAGICAMLNDQMDSGAYSARINGDVIEISFKPSGPECALSRSQINDRAWWAIGWKAGWLAAQA